MKRRVQLKFEVFAGKCLNPRCRKSLNGRKANARTCSQACRKSVSRLLAPEMKLLSSTADRPRSVTKCKRVTTSKPGRKPRKAR